MSPLPEVQLSKLLEWGKRTHTEDFEAPNSRIRSPPVLSDSTHSEEETSDIDISDTEADTGKE
jgi:hypothetical protein